MLKDRTLTAPPIVRTPDDFDSLSSFIILRENENDQILLGGTESLFCPLSFK